MAGRLSGIKNEIAGMLQSITIDNGFDLDFGSVNPADIASKKYPLASITFPSEAPRSDTQAAYGYDDCQVSIAIMCERAQPEAAKTVPLYALDADYDVILDAVKRIIRFRMGMLPLSGESYMVYKGNNRRMLPLFVGQTATQVYCMVIRLSIHYQSTAPNAPAMSLQEAF